MKLKQTEAPINEIHNVKEKQKETKELLAGLLKTSNGFLYLSKKKESATKKTVHLCAYLTTVVNRLNTQPMAMLYNISNILAELLQKPLTNNALQVTNNDSRLLLEVQFLDSINVLMHNDRFCGVSWL